MFRVLGIFNALIINQKITLRYRQYEDEYYNVIKNRLIRPNFIKDQLMLPTDPLGANGPRLDKFLRF